LEGWQKRFETIKNLLADNIDEIPIELRNFEVDFNYKNISDRVLPKIENNLFVIPKVVRDDRFRSKFADYIFAQFLRYRMRFALDFDFTKYKKQKPTDTSGCN